MSSVFRSFVSSAFGATSAVIVLTDRAIPRRLEATWRAWSRPALSASAMMTTRPPSTVLAILTVDAAPTRHGHFVYDLGKALTDAAGSCEVLGKKSRRHDSRARPVRQASQCPLLRSRLDAGASVAA
jgi:hypothetical protein